MRRILSGLFLCASISFQAQASGPVRTVENLDLNSYMGKWHEVASIPSWFQKQCVSDSTAEYSLLDNGQVGVINKCRKSNGEFSLATGRARIHKRYDSNSKLKVTYSRFLGMWWWLFSGDYWVIDLCEDYEYSVVGDRDREHLWILSRTPDMDVDSLLDIRENIRSQGFDDCSVVITQEGELKGKRLCDLEDVR